MKEFYAVHGHYKVPRGYVTENGINLGSWRRTQMHRYKYGTLNEKYLQMIKDAGIMEMLESPFDTAYRHALEFYKIYGNLEMQTGYTCPDGFNLGKWCASIRDNRKKGKVSEDKIALLDELGFDWSTNYQKREMRETVSIKSLSEIYVRLENQQGIAHVEMYYSEHKNIELPENYVCDDGFPLGDWLLRAKFRFRNKGLPADISQRLNVLNKSWAADKEGALDYMKQDAYKKGIKNAREFYQANKHLIVPIDYVCDNGYKLGKWLMTMRSRHNNNKLPAQITVELEKLGIVWHALDIAWFEIFAECRTFLQSHPDEPIPRTLTSKNGRTNLNNWFRQNHMEFKNGRLSPVRAELFAMIDCEPEKLWKTKDVSAWDRHFEEVKDFLDNDPEYSAANFPKSINGKSIKNLSNWLVKQIRRYFKNDGSLTDEQREKLREIGVEDYEFEESYADSKWEQWCRYCLELKAFYEKNGHVRLTENEQELRDWFWTQRVIYQRNEFSERRMKFLEEHGISELFEPVTKNTVTFKVKLPKKDYELILQKAADLGCDTIEEYLIKIANN
ncbi:helicase associated domain-containing protein [uncultured Ruminococcus sp.]|uniref:helicase associated domain-containing protein n=1 Tax=uncultured Ruminococcus sp. TaxID=165186 RepID=UPI0025D9C926|nr:helicase associated domain-containing protein [uncultured Ruminococcus sp.]